MVVISRSAEEGSGASLPAAVSVGVGVAAAMVAQCLVWYLYLSRFRYLR
jgi:hypothetical protein